jgi:hypothetical protein
MTAFYCKFLCVPYIFVFMGENESEHSEWRKAKSNKLFHDEDGGEGQEEITTTAHFIYFIMHWNVCERSTDAALLLGVSELGQN